ncbi:hypothetical protein [Bacillus solimangrovi]|uniref:Uncharacterized protein n=1 Tax=Bacillus solimangrovi TaxID=1305675 RepID=A0A1E5LJJ7_9BACI|nr:hypothetical protein [Bacillus solimangrovi]OEH94241.1 hypothetical protein BFG57_09335 [Bacillus solimangrovi]
MCEIDQTKINVESTVEHTEIEPDLIVTNVTGWVDLEQCITIPGETEGVERTIYLQSQLPFSCVTITRI